MIRFFCLILLLLPTAASADAPMRIVSIGGALTETIYAIGAGDRIVGSDTTSYYPEAAAALPKVGYQRALSAEGILSLGPELIIMSDESGPPAVLEQLKKAGVNMLTLTAGRSLEDVKTTIETISKTLEKESEGASLIAQITGMQDRLREVSDRQTDPPHVMFILQHSGGAPMVAGKNTAADSIIRLAGGINAVADYEGYKPLSPESAASLAPDVLLLTTQGLAQAGGEASLLSVPGLSLTPAAGNGRIIAMDALLLLGFGPRTAEAALELNKQLYNP
ncbi:ABC transporter substrate-binding protein [Sneathiella chungangensis]|uniref:ABC transporter substrate-binding protein n=1 Tax=Sneathiella chungangensis TaxID=1418234 RepID=A0A845MIN6_9PROT|nr:ABC transporter substrate-binding protein [Sneathiella chungangensis]MZR22854.1 ABC transporter substrate-binding protein [Sneathiella chungangensis]